MTLNAKSVHKVSVIVQKSVKFISRFFYEVFYIGCGICMKVLQKQDLWKIYKSGIELALSIRRRR